MKQLFLTVLLLSFATTCFAGGVLPKQLQVTPDVLIADKAPGIVKGSTISLNYSYISVVKVYERDTQTMVRFVVGDFNNLSDCPNLSAEFHGRIGRVAYKAINDQIKVWKKSNSFPVSDPAIFGQTDVRINPKHFVGFIDASEHHHTELCNQNGMYPEWHIFADVVMTPAEYATFKTKLAASGLKVEEVPAPVSDGGR